MSTPYQLPVADTAAAAWPLHDNATMRLRPGAAGFVVRVDRGSVLVTQEGDPQDHVLGPGDAFRAAGKKAVVLWALSSAGVAVTER